MLTGLAAYDEERARLDDGAQAVSGQIASCNYFQVMDQAMALGRGFTESECTGKATADVVVLSNALWRENYASDPAIVGRIVRMNRVPMTVIGVAGTGFSGTDLVESKFWAPLPMMRTIGGGGGSTVDFTAWNVNWLELIGKRRPGVSVAEVFYGKQSYTTRTPMGRDLWENICALWATGNTGQSPSHSPTQMRTQVAKAS